MEIYRGRYNAEEICKNFAEMDGLEGEYITVSIVYDLPQADENIQETRINCSRVLRNALKEEKDYLGLKSYEALLRRMWRAYQVQKHQGVLTEKLTRKK